jgi:hypothetical protein
VRVDKWVGSGVAKVTLSFEEWKEGKVKPAVVAVPVNPPPAKAKK